MELSRKLRIKGKHPRCYLRIGKGLQGVKGRQAEGVRFGFRQKILKNGNAIGFAHLAQGID